MKSRLGTAEVERYGDGKRVRKVRGQASPIVLEVHHGHPGFHALGPAAL
jgi:hypothetical protein